MSPPSRQICLANRLPGNGCTVERLMRALGIRGVVRGKRVVTTNPDTSLPCPDDKVNRIFKADRPNKLWVSDFTYVPTWSGTVYVAPCVREVVRCSTFPLFLRWAG